MKQYIILGCAISLVIFLNMFQNNYLEKSSKEWLEIIDEIKINIEKSNYEMANNSFIKLENNWEEKKKVLDIFTEHDDVEELESNLASLKAYINLKEYSDCINEIAILKQRIGHILENESLSFATIF